MAEKKKLLAEQRTNELGKGEKINSTGMKNFAVATGLRFGQAGNSGLLQTYLAGFIVSILAMQKVVATNANIISSLISFLTIPLVGFIGDKIGRRKIYMILSMAMAIYAIPMMLMINTKNPVWVTIAMIIGLNVGVQGLFALENVMMAELFGSLHRMTLMAMAKETGGLIATGFGPLIAAALVTAMTGSWVPIAAMIIVFSLITFFSAKESCDTNEVDLNALEDPKIVSKTEELSELRDKVAHLEENVEELKHLHI